MAIGRSELLGADLRAVREARQLTVTTVATAAAIAEVTLRSIESGRRYPSLRTLEALAECLQVEIVVSPRETTVVRL